MNKQQHKKTIGPIQLLAIGFKPGAKFEGKILKELERLDRIKTIRILDLLFVKKDEQTKDLVALSIQGETLGAIIGALLGFDFEGNHKKEKKRESEDNNDAFGLNVDQIKQIGDTLIPGAAAGILLIEHVWAKNLKLAIRGAGGTPLAEGFLTPEAIAEVIDEITAITETMDQIEKAETYEHAHSL